MDEIFMIWESQIRMKIGFLSRVANAGHYGIQITNLDELWIWKSQKLLTTI